MQRLAFISDDRYISEETRRDVKEAVEEKFSGFTFGSAFYHSIIDRNVAGYPA